ncbi:hypothetical protein [Mycolicibacter minnesotensis]
MGGYEISNQSEWELAVDPDVLMDILWDVEALPDLTKPYLPSWVVLDVKSKVVERDGNGAPALVRTTTSGFGLRDSVMSRYDWTSNGCSWRLVSSRFLKTAGGRMEITTIDGGSRLAAHAYAVAKTAPLLGPILSPLFGQAEKLQQLGIEALPEIINAEAARRGKSAEA